MANEHKYDEIQFFKDGTSIGITCLPNYSTETLRNAIRIHICGQTIPDRFVIISDGEISLESDINPLMKKEIAQWQTKRHSA